MHFLAVRKIAQQHATARFSYRISYKSCIIAFVKAYYIEFKSCHPDHGKMPLNRQKPALQKEKRMLPSLTNGSIKASVFLFFSVISYKFLTNFLLSDP